VDATTRAEIDDALARLADGDRSAFDPMFSALWPIVLSLSTRMLGSGADAEDAAQQAMFKIFDRIGEYDRDRSGVSWALGIAAWECRAARTKRARRREDGAADPADGPTDLASPEALVTERQLVAAAREILESLSVGEQETLRATFEEWPGASGPTFRKRRERAMARLRNAWRRIYGTN
jgi:RNA polymerase sigma-70 factor (ECF subfamily)